MLHRASFPAPFRLDGALGFVRSQRLILTVARHGKAALKRVPQGTISRIFEREERATVGGRS